jgi:manganese/zinc/iron transport system permease protein
LSAAAPDLPTGPIIVLVATGAFTLSLLFAPLRGAVAGVIRQRRFRARILSAQETPDPPDLTRVPG